MPLFDIAELVRIGVEDEKSGTAFYSQLAQTTTSADLKAFYADLAEQEKRHEKRFQDLLADLGTYTPTESYDGEYISYLRAMLDSRAFHDPITARKIAAEIGTDDDAALSMAIRFERDTLVMLNELREMVPERDRPVVDDLAREEQGHLVDLNRALKQKGE